MIHCKRCDKFLTENMFGSDKSRVSGKSIYCKRCRARLAKVSRKEKPQVGRNYSRLKRYGLSSEQYKSMLQKQNGLCAICGTDKPGAGHSELYIDHDHSTGTIRGLLCRDCNLMLGYSKDDPNRLLQAIQYLEIYGRVSRRSE